MEKSNIEIDEDDLAVLIRLVSSKGRQLENLSAIKKEETIELLVKTAISILAGISIEEINNDDLLSMHLSPIQIQSLAIPFSFIAKRFDPHTLITLDQCETLISLRDCMDLIKN